MPTSKPAARHRSLRVLLATSLVGVLAVAAAAPASAAPNPKVNTSVSHSSATNETGALFTTTISYACSSSQVNCQNAVLTMTLPANLDNPTSVVTTPHVASWDFGVAGPRVLRFTFIP